MMKTSHVMKTLSAAVFIQSAAPSFDTFISASESSGIDSFSVELNCTNEIIQTPRVIKGNSRVTTSDKNGVISVGFNAPLKWRKDTKSRYSLLVEREALGSISTAEELELDSLQKLKRRETNRPSGEEVVYRYQQEKIGVEILKIVNRYVRINETKDSKKRSSA